MRRAGGLKSRDKGKEEVMMILKEEMPIMWRNKREII
jgi:hypothetical protein